MYDGSTDDVNTQQGWYLEGDQAAIREEPIQVRGQ